MRACGGLLLLLQARSVREKEMLWDLPQQAGQGTWLWVDGYATYGSYQLDDGTPIDSSVSTIP